MCKFFFLLDKHVQTRGKYCGEIEMIYLRNIRKRNGRKKSKQNCRSEKQVGTCFVMLSIGRRDTKKFWELLSDNIY